MMSKNSLYYNELKWSGFSWNSYNRTQWHSQISKNVIITEFVIYKSDYYILSTNSCLCKIYNYNLEMFKENVKYITSCFSYLVFVTKENKVIVYQDDNFIELCINIKNIKQIICSNTHIIVRDENNNIHIHGSKVENLNKVKDEYKNFNTVCVNLNYKVIDMFMTEKYAYVLSSNYNVYELDYRLEYPEKSNSYRKVAKNINVINKLRTINEWSSNDHIEFPKKFRDNIEIFLFCLKRKQMESKIYCFKVPKFVLFEIIKKIHIKN